MTDDRYSWASYQPGLRGFTAPGEDNDVARRRYELEPHILETVPFDAMVGCVAEFGCGIGTDGALIARSARPYIGLDYSPLALAAALRAHTGLGSSFARADLRSVPLRNGVVDFVYSHGVLHHIRDGGAPWAEVNRVLKPGGRFCIMVYHRHSLNYYYGILFLRRVMLLFAVLFPGLAQRISQRRGETPDTLEKHLAMLRLAPTSYLWGSQWLSHNTDGPQNTYSRAFSRRELKDAISTAGLEVDHLEVRYLNARVNPPLDWLPKRIQSWLGRSIGWHLYAHGHKA